VPETKMKVLIAGAGLGGLTAALAMLRRGMDVEVYEQAPELKEVGAGVQISANGTGVLFALGLEAGVRKWGVHAVDKEIRLWNTGQTWSLFNSLRPPSGGERYSYPMFMLHRGDLHAMLVDAVLALKPDAIRLSRRCTGFSQDARGVRLAFQEGTDASGDVLIGADGLHSVIRKQLFGAAQPRFTGQVAWRGLVPIEQLPADQRRLVGTNWVGPKAHVTCYPVHRGEFFNFVGQVDRTDWQVESWITEGSKEECLGDFPGWHPHVHSMIEHSPKLFKWGLFLREPLPRWTEGRVTLLGDACHAMLPYLGQGANMALEDGYVLARCLQTGAKEPQRALQRYEAARRERTTRIVNSSAEMTGKFHNEALADAAGAEAYVNTEWHPDKIRARYDWIYQYDAHSVSV
jgi:salicylate hydroxylase